VTMSQITEGTSVKLPLATLITVIAFAGGAVAGGYKAREMILSDMRTEMTERIKPLVTKEELYEFKLPIETRLARMEQKMDLLLERRP
jgi:hypothetical protein